MKATGCYAKIAAAAFILLAAAAVVPATAADLACNDPVACVGDCRQQCNMMTLETVSAAILEGFVKDAGENITVPVLMETFTEDVVVRSVPFGVFATRKTAAEYFGFENGLDGLARVFQLTGGSLWGFVVQNQVGITGTYIGVKNMDLEMETNVSVISSFSFNNVSKVQYMDAHFLRFPEAMKRIKAADTLKKPEIKNHTRNYICDIHQQFCTGKLQPYSSRAECIAFLVSRPMVNANFDFGGNNNMCRLLHATLLHTAPEIHCPHIGPTGGKTCVDGVFDSPESFDLFPLGAFLALS